MAIRMHPSFLSAARAGNKGRLRRLLQDDRTLLYGMTIKGNSILHIVANLGNDWLIAEACDSSEWDLLQRQNLKGDTILHCAARAGHDHILSLLIGHQAGRQMTGVLNQRGDSALHEAARGGHAKVCRQLLAVGENMVSMVNGDGESPLYLAAVRGSVEIVEMLLECTMVDYRGPRGQTALHAAVYKCYANRQGFPISIKFAKSSLALAEMAVKMLLECAMDCYYRITRGAADCRYYGNRHEIPFL
ncbi:hypothetical protein IEQ34_002133 [Dendrobium chrysotoxum]|uniref:Uncharacterized protein n=1 Tax=Dendrobium chrysotoxum TaxID=161865 RepID=A0AAV7HIQ1_DENCH|nr:hypothetical protein IEQ34_002133 [Dendrobium chrysotoxum]